MTHTIHSPTIALLLTCLQFHFGTVSIEHICQELGTEIDWDRLLQTAIEQGVLPLLYQSLKPIAEKVPPAVMAELHNNYRLNGLHTFSQTKGLLRVVNQLKSHGIDAIVFKGAVLATAVYGNIAARQFNDLDLLVKLEDFWTAKQALLNLGYQPSASEIDEKVLFNLALQISLHQSDAESKLLNQKLEQSRLHSNPERSVDLHWGIAPRRFQKSDRFNQLWKNVQTVNLIGQTVQTFSPEAMLVVQCLNVAKEPEHPALKHLCDVAQIIQAYPDLDWHRALELSAALHNQKLFLIGLSVTQSILQIHIPSIVSERLIQHPFDRILTDNQPSSVMRTLWLHYTHSFKTLDQWQDCFFLIRQYFNLLISRYLLGINERDRESITLPGWLFFLYYLLRPLRLVMTYSPIRKVI